MSHHTILFLIFFMAAITNTFVVADFGDTTAQSSIDLSCVIRGESSPPPPFVVLRWDTSGQCDYTVDHFMHFYDIRSIISNNTDYILFLESN
jgi:hypothetical protein